MSLRIGDIAPDFNADTTEGEINFHQWGEGSYVLLFSHPKDFTPVCTTELGYLAAIKNEFDKRNCKILGLSVDSIEEHHAWSKDIEDTQGHALNYPLIADPNLEVAKQYDMLPAKATGHANTRTPVDNMTVRSVFLIGPDRLIKLILTYPMATGRNFEEILRALDSIQLSTQHQVATPANWKRGDKVIIVTSLSDEEAAKKFPEGWDAPRPYLRFVSEPED